MTLMLRTASLFVLLCCVAFDSCARRVSAEFRAGAAVVDITPEKLPVIVNGGFLSRKLDQVKTRLNARAIVLADTKRTVALVVVDSCMLPRPLIDDVKQLVATDCGIPANRILISATHTHSAPSCMGALGTEADPDYVPYIKKKLVEAINRAQARLEPAKVGFGTADAAEFTALRRWIRRPDRIDFDPFGNQTVRANMHAASNWDNVTGESGPEDPEFSLISIQTRQGKPLAILANFSMHYFGDKNLSADYFGLFCEGLKTRVAKGDAFVAALSHGCSGDIWKRDYSVPAAMRNDKQTIQDYTRNLLDVVASAWENVEYRSDVDLAMAERRMTLKYRTPDKQRLEWAKRIVAEMNGDPPANREQVYALEQVELHNRQETEIVLQALRIGDIGIASTPNETYAITGLKIKSASPLKHTMVIELANGGDGYIPPPEQHLFGGYNTWAARSAGLEVQAEPKIAEACLGLLEQVAGRPRQTPIHALGPASQQILRMKPTAWWRLNELQGPRAVDASGQNRDAFFEPAVTYYLPGPHSDQFCGTKHVNRSAMFAGGRLQARLNGLDDQYTISMWFWNGMPSDAREFTGWLCSKGYNHGLHSSGIHLGLGGKGQHAGKLVVFAGKNPRHSVSGKVTIPRWQWNHVVLVCNQSVVQVYLNGKLELKTDLPAKKPVEIDNWYFGGRSDNSENWEGRLDEIVVFDRALTLEEVKKLSIRN